jgi:hypothetical protein
MFGYALNRMSSRVGAFRGIIVTVTAVISTGCVAAHPQSSPRSGTAAGDGTGSTAASSSVSKPGETPTDCFSNPASEGTARIEACGYPGEHNTGVPEGTTLTEVKGSVILATEGEVYKDKKVVGGQIRIIANNVTLEDDEVEDEQLINDTGEVKVEGKSDVIRHVAIHGRNEYEHKGEHAERKSEGGGAIKSCMENGSESTRVEYTQLYYCGNIHAPGGIFEHDYCPGKYVGWESHYECFIDQGGYGPRGETSGGRLVIRHDTLFNPHPQTADIAAFCEEPTNEGRPKKHPIGELVIEDNFLAGGGHTAYLGATTKASGGSHCKPAAPGVNVAGPVIVKGNRLARCLTAPEFTGSGEKVQDREAIDGGYVCEKGEDKSGYYPYAGSFGHAGIWTGAEPSVTTITGNYWDDDLQAVP